MKKVALLLVGLVVVALVGVFGAAATRPDAFECTRTRDMRVPRAAVEPLVGELRNWTRWSPWQDLDPAQRLTYGTTTSGVGASYAWEGNEDVGRGSMRITGVDALPDRTVYDFDLHFLEPFESRADVRMQLVDTGAGTRVTWSMRSTQSLPEKVFGLFVDMDEMLGRDFEKGLERIEARAGESAPAR